jgi:hypothetical protein
MNSPHLQAYIFVICIAVAFCAWIYFWERKL